MSTLENLPNSYFESINDFLFSEQIKPLGSGSFGVVRKGVHKMTNKVYAIKIIKLEYNITQSELLLLSREISIHYKLDHPHIIKLWAVLSEADKLYMIMDYAQNGNLFSYLNKRSGVTEQQSFKIFYQVLEAVQYMHKEDVFHRDLKPENILLDHQMNVRICDFGWVADDINRKRTTFCGTYQYMAPQMISQTPYNYKIDIWAMGILLYQLNHGKAPFQAETIESIKIRFEKGIYEIKQQVTEAFKVLIVSLLQFQPAKRLEIIEIKNSQWVQKNKKYFQNLATLQLKPSDIKSTDSSQTILASKQSQKKKQILLNNYTSTGGYYGNTYIKNSGTPEQQNKKRHRKKYKTLQEQDLYCISQNLKVSSKHQQNNFNLNINTKVLQPISENVGYRSNLGVGFNNNNNVGLGVGGEKTTRKKKIGSARGHMRTESSQVLMNKFNKIIFNSDKNRMAETQKQKDEKKKRQFTKR